MRKIKQWEWNELIVEWREEWDEVVSDKWNNNQTNKQTINK